jgi:citrate lyase subunit alpha/citrate CoA-transferase
MSTRGITAGFALGGITAAIADLHKKGLVKTVVDVQSFDSEGAASLRTSPAHVEISASEYANPTSKAAYVDRVDAVILSALEIDLNFNVNVITGSDGVIRGASGGHCDVAAAANLVIVVAPLVRGRIPTVVRHVATMVTPGESIDVLVTDHGIAVNPKRPEVEQRLVDARLPVMTIDELHQRAMALTGEPEPLEFTERIVGIIRYRDGSVIDVVREVKN